jgi:hypothetical protein
MSEALITAIQQWSAAGRVSRVSPVQTAMCNCTRDEGMPKNSPMNRHRRRAAAKLGVRGNPDGAAIPPDVPALFGIAVMHHQAGQLAKAEACYWQVL